WSVAPGTQPVETPTSVASTRPVSVPSNTRDPVNPAQLAKLPPVPRSTCTWSASASVPVTSSATRCTSPGPAGPAYRTSRHRGTGRPGASSVSVNSAWRSEEHTSELQSPYDLVCRLLLEKKKKKKTQ